MNTPPVSLAIVTILSTALATACGAGNATASAPVPVASSSAAATSAATDSLSPTTTALPATSGSGVKLGLAGGAPSSSAEAATVKGNEPGRSRDEIRDAVVARRELARACYDKAEAAHPGIEGDITITFVIDPKGIVKNTQVDPARTTIQDAAVGSCIIDIVNTISFPASPKGFETKAAYPFNFHPKKTVPQVPPPKG